MHQHEPEGGNNRHILGRRVRTGVKYNVQLRLKACYAQWAVNGTQVHFVAVPPPTFTLRSRPQVASREVSQIA